MPQPEDPVVVFTGTVWQAEQLRGLLENAGVESLLRDEVMGRIDAPALAAGAFGAVKLVVARRDVAQAEQILKGFGVIRGVRDEGADLPPLPPWLCVHCGEQVDEPLDACWNCGAARGD